MTKASHTNTGKTNGAACTAPIPPGTRRVVAPGVDLEYPAVIYPTRRLFEMLGEGQLRRLVQRHHERLRDSRIGHLFAADPEAFERSVTRIADYVIEACGGPARYTQANGIACIRTRHFPHSIDEAAREVWLHELAIALREVDFPLNLMRELWEWLESMSIRMINRRTAKKQPARWPFERMRTTLQARDAGVGST